MRPTKRIRPDNPDKLPALSALELLRIAPLDEAATLSGVSVPTLLRRHRDKIVRVSPRRLGMRVRDALQLNETDAA